MFYDNLKLICEKRGVKLTPLVKECGGAKGSLSNWKKGASPNSDIVVRLAERLNVSIDLLLKAPDNAQKMMEKLNRPNPTPDEEDLMNKYRSVSESSKSLILERATALFELENLKKPTAEISHSGNTEKLDEEAEPLYLDLYDMPVSAGGGTYIDYTTAEPMQVPRNDQTEDANYMVRISGDSMEPRFFNGDIVLVETTTELEQGEIGIFILNSEAYIKQLGDGCLISLNKKYDPIFVSENDSCVLKGRVIGILDIKKGA